MQEIKEWLQTGDFVNGVNLFEKHGGSAFLVKLFRQQGPNPYNINKLKTELQKLVPTDEIAIRYVAPSSKQSKHVEQPATPAPVPRPPQEQQHREYLQLKKNVQTVYRQLDHNIAALNISKSKNTRHETAKQILSLHRKLMGLLDLIEYYDLNGCFPNKEPEKEVVTPEMQRLYVQIWKAERTLAKPDCRNRAKTEKLLQEKKNRLEQLKQQA